LSDQLLDTTGFLYEIGLLKGQRHRLGDRRDGRR